MAKGSQDLNRRAEPAEPGIGRVVLEDLRNLRVPRRMGHDMRDVYRFYIREDQREQLEGMGRIKRSAWSAAWFLKAVLVRLTPLRRFAVLVSMACLFLGDTSFFVPVLNSRFETDLQVWGYLILLGLLTLELKDKLHARDEIEVARQVQISLLPRSCPVLDGWSIWLFTRPANDVGGDLVDTIELSQRRLGVTLGDVAGKGLGAALLAAKLQATLKALVLDHIELSDLAQRANSAFCRDGMDNRFATLFFCEITPDSGEIRFFNAGHCPPYVVGPGGARRLEPGSLPLGILEDAAHCEERVELDPGDLFLIYSDGLTEACNEKDEMFGEGALQTLLPRLAGLSPEQMGRRLAREVDEFVDHQRLGDDLSLIIMQRTAR